MNRRLFLSCASGEFHHIRDQLTKDFQRPGVDVKSHEEVAGFNMGLTTLEKLDDYISGSQALVHLLGQTAGTQAEPAGIEAILRRHPDISARLPQITPLLSPSAAWRGSYTQWEAYLALYHRIPWFVFIAGEGFQRPVGLALSPEEKQLQADHNRRLKQREQDRKEFFSREDLRVEMQRSLNEILPPDGFLFQADIARTLKYAPEKLIGRDGELKLLNDTWLKVRRAESPRPHVLTFVALGGEGKTSLVTKWAAEMAAQDWPGCDAAFAWSFYSQGAGEQRAASSDLFLNEALIFFGDNADKQFAASNSGAFEKGKRLARIVGQRRSLLILDGLEPLQYAPTSPTPGELKDQGIAALLKGLAANSRGLCLVTTRYSLPDLRVYWQTTAPEKLLPRLSTPAGVHLLQKLGVRKESGSPAEFEKLVEDVKGHALTLNLLGTYLRDAHAGDLRKRDLVKLAEADTEEQGGHAFRVMDAYGNALQNEGEKGQRALTMLRLLGLFDQPATVDCLDALWQIPAIAGLTEPLMEMSKAQRNLVLRRLEDAKLLTVNREKSGELISLDAHPLLREYFARQLRENNAEAWRLSHRRLYEHLCASTPDKPQPTLEDLQPLYQAVAHGCQAAFHQQCFENVFCKRIQRNQKYYSTRQLGAYGSDLGAIACFFDSQWLKPSTSLGESRHGKILFQAAFDLRASGRLAEALDPLRTSLSLATKQVIRKAAAVRAINLSELELILGNVDNALMTAEQSVTYSDQCDDVSLHIGSRACTANALHQAGRRAEAETFFQNCERMKSEHIPRHPLLASDNGFEYCELLISTAERAAWKRIINVEFEVQSIEIIELCRDATVRASTTRKWTTSLLSTKVSYSFFNSDFWMSNFGFLQDRLVERGSPQRKLMRAHCTISRVLSSSVLG